MKTQNIATDEFMSATRMLDRYANDRGSKQYKAAAAVVRLSLNNIHAEICSRCSGAGGYKYWPAFTCFQCSGRGYNVPKTQRPKE